jgi:Ca2+:H+ antiporter
MLKNISISGAVILLLIYAGGLMFSMRTHRFLFMPVDEEHHAAQWSKRTAIIMLFAATCVVAYLSEAFVGSIEYMVHNKTINMSEMFIGVIVVAVVGNAAEGMVAVWVARENKMELSFQIAMGSCLQVGLLVAPVLVIASLWIGDRFMPLQFNPFELLALIAATLIASASLNDRESNWLEGAMFLALYIFFAMVFWFHP